MYKYKVIKNNDEKLLEEDLNQLAANSWRLVSASWNNDESMIFAVMEKVN
jgi:hypothetical protein